MDDVSAQGRAKNIALECGPIPPRAPVRADRTLIGRALTNLLSNAIKYSPADTTVSLGVLRAGDAFRCVIADQGPGISAQDLPRMFHSFQRVETDKNVRRKEGAGLGLAFVKTAAERHGGTVGVESELGQGSRFWLELPAA